jgi:probable rRNA maturation factor
MTIQIAVADNQDSNPVDDQLVNRIEIAVRKIASDFGFVRGEVSIAVFDDSSIQTINRDYLEHDWPTDVITFPLESDDDWIEGEIVVSRETADRVAVDLPWTGDDELLLYVIHGMLHLVGFDDTDEDLRRQMKDAERKYLIQAEVPHAHEHQ